MDLISSKRPIRINIWVILVMILLITNIFTAYFLMRELEPVDEVEIKGTIIGEVVDGKRYELTILDDNGVRYRIDSKELMVKYDFLETGRFYETLPNDEVEIIDG